MADMATDITGQHAGLFDDDPISVFDTPKESNAGTEASLGSKEGSSHPEQDIEAWLIGRLRKIIPEDTQAMYINKNSILFAHEECPMSDDDEDHSRMWLLQLTNGGRRSILSSFDISAPYTKIVSHRMEEARKKVAIDYRTDPSFLRVIDAKSGKYILSNLVKLASEQRAGLMNYVEYVERSIHAIPLLEELNRYALMQKIAYRGARKQLWFIMGLAEELKLVQRTKSFKYKIMVGKNPEHDQKVFLLDKQVTSKWLHRKSENSSISSEPSYRTMSSGKLDELLNASYTEDPSLEYKTFGSNSSIFDMNTSVDPPDGFSSTFTGFFGSNSSNFEDSIDVPRSMSSLHGTSSWDSWNMLEQSRTWKVRTSEEQTVDSVQRALERIGSKRSNHHAKNASSTLMILEAACKLYGTGPKWSNPDKSEFDASNKRSKLVYVKPPKNVDQSSIAYHYLMQYKSVHQKLNGGTRQQHAVSYGLITLVTPKQGDPNKSYQVNPRPWDDQIYAHKWHKLGSYIGKSVPWAMASKVPCSIRQPAVESNPPPEDTTNEECVSVSQTEEGLDQPTDSLKQDISKVEHFVLTESETSKPLEPLLMPDVTLTNAAVKEEDREEGQGPSVPHEEAPSVSEELCHSKAHEPEAESAPLEKDNPVVLDTELESGAVSLEQTVQDESVDTQKVREEASHTECDVETSTDQGNILVNTAIDPNMDAPGPVQLAADGMKQMKLTELFRYVYTKMKKVKPLPECSPELLGRKEQQKVRVKKQPKPVEEVPVAGKRKRILDDDFVEEALDLNYAPIPTQAQEKGDGSDYQDKGIEIDKTTSQEKAPKTDEATKISKRARIHKMREFLKNMFEVEAEESDDENLSDPEDIRKKLQLLKERLQNSEGESESDLETDTDVAEEMKDFIGEVDKLNQEDEELARQRFFADMAKQEENELSKLMPLKERSEREMTRREGRMKLLMQLKNGRNFDGIADLHLSDFESSDEEEGTNQETGKKKRRLSKEDLEKLLKFRKEMDRKSQDVTRTEELQQFVDFKLQKANRHINEDPVVKNQVERITKDKRSVMDTMLSSKLDSAVFGEPTTVRSTDPFGEVSNCKPKVVPPSLFRPPKSSGALAMKSFRWNQSAMKPLNSTNTRNVGGFTGFHSLTNALRHAGITDLLNSNTAASYSNKQ